MNTKILELIKVVNDNYNHIQQLETLEELLKNDYPDEYIVAKTTHNAHYDYRYLGHRKFQNPLNHIDCFIDKEWLNKGCISGIDKPLSFIKNPEEIYWDK